MGCYVNPSRESKEDFLRREGKVIQTMPSSVKEIPTGFMPVCLVNNGAFTAAAVGYSDREIAEFTRRDDRRPRTYYMVPIAKLKEVCDIESYLRN